jgi:hypothetical protein
VKDCHMCPISRCTYFVCQVFSYRMYIDSNCQDTLRYVWSLVSLCHLVVIKVTGDACVYFMVDIDATYMITAISVTVNVTSLICSRSGIKPNLLKLESNDLLLVAVSPKESTYPCDLCILMSQLFMVTFAG